MAEFRWPNPFVRGPTESGGRCSLWVGDRLARYLLVGASGVVVNLGVLLLFVEGVKWSPLLAAPLAIEASILTNYALNRNWTWRDRGQVPFSLARYHGVSLVGMGIQWAALAGLFYLVGLHYLLAAVVGIALATGWTFFSNDRFTFTPKGSMVVPRTVLYSIALLVHLAVAALLAHPWDTFVFQSTVKDFLGAGISPYTTAVLGGDHIYLGRHLPIQQHWYAYPPLPLLLLSLTYLPSAVGLVDPAWASRILIKLPAILGTLALAFTARHLVGNASIDSSASLSGSWRATAAEGATPVEKWFLFNPLFILIAGVWGQMEALIVLFLVLSVLVMRTRHWAWAGFFWGLAVLVKPFALFLVPVLGIHLVRTGGMRSVRRFFGAGIGVAALVSLPFLLMEPTGFLRQTLFMHMERPPSRFAPLAAVYYMFREGAEIWPATMPDPVAVAAVIGGVSLVATLIMLGVLALASSRQEASEGALLFWMAISMLGALITGKVLNEQYLLLPLGLLAVWFFHPRADPGRRPAARLFLLAASWGVVIAALTERAALFHFIPDDITQWAFGKSALAIFSGVAWSLGFTVSGFRLLMGSVALVFLLLCFLAALRLLVPELKRVWATIPRQRGAFISTGTASGRISVVVVVFVLLMGYPLAAAVMTTPTNGLESMDDGDTEPEIFAIYRTDWYNPTHDPLIRAGSWTNAQLTPSIGYHNLNAHKVSKDLAMMSEAGVQGVLIVLHPMHMQEAGTVKRIAEAKQMPYAMVLDLRLADNDATGASGGGWSDHQMEKLVAGPPVAGWAGPHYLRDPETGEPYLFIRHDGQHAPGDGVIESVHPDWSEWTDAFRDPQDAQMVTVSENPQPEAGQAPSSRSTQTESMTHEDSQGFVWFTGDPFTPETYREAWEETASDANGVMVPWNEFDLGNAVEPTREHGEVFLEITRTGAQTVARSGT